MWTSSKDFSIVLVACPTLLWYYRSSQIQIQIEVVQLKVETKIQLEIHQLRQRQVTSRPSSKGWVCEAIIFDLKLVYRVENVVQWLSGEVWSVVQSRAGVGVSMPDSSWHDFFGWKKGEASLPNPNLASMKKKLVYHVKSYPNLASMTAVDY